MRMMKTPRNFMLGVGLTAAAVAMVPVVRTMMNKNSNNQMSSGNNVDNYSLH